LRGLKKLKGLKWLKKNFKTPLLAGGVHPDRCGIAAERLEAGWWNKMRLFSIAADFSRRKKEEEVLIYI